MHSVFIDGKEGTTGLQIYERLGRREDIEIITLPEGLRKDPAARREAIRSADVVFLCLPDAAAKEAVALAGDAGARIIDASTAHRTTPGWAYGFPELSAAHRERIAGSRRIANPGCYASGFISLVYPLIAHGIADSGYPFVCHAVSGYSGAGKKGIAQYEDPARPPEFDTPRLYATSMQHKHLPEMAAVCGLTQLPAFCPYVCDYYAGMTVSVPLHASLLRKKVTPDDLLALYGEHYGGSRFISVSARRDAYVSANRFNGTNLMEIAVYGNEDRILLTSSFDNLGKGASGAAVQNMNIALGLDETEGLL